MKKKISVLSIIVFLCLCTAYLVACSQTIKVTFNALNGDVTWTARVEKGGKVTQPEKPVRNGYTFDGWYVSSTDFSEDNKWSFLGYSVSENMTLYAKWDIITYTLSYDNLFGAINLNSARTTYTVEDEITFIEPFGRPGYTGIWNPETISKGSTGDKTITAVWTLEDYLINYTNLQNGQLPVNAPVTYTITSDTINFAPPIRTGYTGYWDTALIPTGSTGNKTITAVWTPNQYAVSLDPQGGENSFYQISFNLNGGTGTAPATQTITPAKGLTYPANPARSNYLFGGWYTNSECTGSPYDFSAAVTEDSVLYAKWLSVSGYGSGLGNGRNGPMGTYVHNNTIIYHPYVPLVNQTITISTTYVNSRVKVSLHNTFLSQLASGTSAAIGGNISFTCSVTAGNLYFLGVQTVSGSTTGTCSISMASTVTPLSGGIAEASMFAKSIAVSYDAVMPAFPAPVKSGFVFGGYFTKPDGAGVQYYNSNMESIKNWDIAEDAVLYAKWEFI